MAGEHGVRILLVDNDKDLLDLLRYNFEKEGFRVKTVSKASKVIPAVVEFHPELIVLDVSMPDGNGIDLCREIRMIDEFNDTFIFFLSARSATACREEALEIGADDFIEKLSGLRALTNKVNAVLKNKFVIRKSEMELVSDELIINKKTEAVYVNDKEITLSAPEFEILFFLMQNPNKVVSRKNLIKIIWGSEVFVLDSSVENYVESLQRKIGTKFIRTIGDDRYCFIQTRG